MYSQASRKISRAVAKADANFVQALDKLVNDYKTNFAALSIKAQGCVAGSYEVEVWSEKLDAADGLITKAKKENNLERFLGTALAHIFMAVEGREVETLVIDSCDKSALCFPLAEALQDFSKDLHLLLSQKEASAQKAVRDAVAKTAQEKQKAAVQAESAVKEKAEWMQQNQKVQSQLQATNVREIAALRSIDQIKRELKEFSGGFKKRAEGLDVLEQTSYTWKTQLSAEIKRASSNEARVAMLDVRLVDTRAKVDKLAAQVAELEEEQVEKSEIVNQLTGERQELTQQVAALQGTLGTLQGFKGKLADEQARHQATLQAGAELKDQLAATQQQLTEAQQTASDFQAQLELTENRLAAQQQCLEDANQKATSSQIHLQDAALEAVNKSATSFLTPLKATQQWTAAEMQGQEDWYVPSCQSPVHGARQLDLADCNTKQGAQGDLVGEKQCEQASAEAVADAGHQVDSLVAQRRPSPQQVATEAHASTDLAGALTQHPGRASPSSALAPAAPLTDPSCLKSKLPAQAVLRVEDYPPSLPWWNAATAGVTVFVPDCGAEDQQSVMPLEQETVPASAVASGLAAAALNPTAAALNLESEQGQQGEYVPSMPWYDPLLAPACAAAACGEPVDHSTQSSLSMFGQGVDNAAASPCEDTASDVDDAQPQVATEALALSDLAEGLSQESDRASPSSAMAPTEPLTDPNTPSPEPILPAQAVVRDRMFVSKGFQRIVEAEYDEGQHGSWREACTMFDAGVPSKVYTTPRNLLFSMLGRGASGEVHYGQKQVGRRGVKEAVALKWVPLQGDGDKQTTKQEVASLKAVGKSLARMPLPHHIICHKDDYRVKTDDGRLYHVIITGYSEGVALGEALAPHRARRHFVSLVQRCLHQTFQGIDVLHNCGWAHMHIKINNVQADISARGRQVQCQVIDLGSAIKASAREYVLRMPPWSLSPELIRAITPGTPPEAHPGSSEQGGEQEGEQEGGQEGEQDGEESQAAGDVHFVLLQHQLWAEDYATPAATLKLSNMLEAHIADAELRMQAVSLMLKLLHPNPYDRGTVQEALTSNFLAL
ncbi:hypothetical protein WJX82_010522 [Trebouxia sp. C0006]